jgi:glycosyltransferase involved in cell wall biosynthesis
LQEKAFPSVSIVITGKDESETIEKCILSVFDQSYPNFETIYIDSNSTDGTFEIALRLQNASKSYANCRRYLPLSIDTNSAASGRNFGVNIAQGDIIAFVDADCVPERSWLENLIIHFSKDTLVVGGPNIHSRTNCSKLCGAVYDVLETFLGSGGSAQFLKINRLSYVNAIPTCNLAIEKKLFYAVGGFNDELRFNEDSDLCHKLRKAGYKMLYSPEAKVNHLRGIKSYHDFSHLIKEYGYQRGRNVAKWPRLFTKFNAVSIICIFIIFLLGAMAVFEKAAQTILVWLFIFLLAVIMIASTKIAIEKRSLTLILFAPAIYLTIYVVYNVSFIRGLVEGAVRRINSMAYGF